MPKTKISTRGRLNRSVVLIVVRSDNSTVKNCQNLTIKVNLSTSRINLIWFFFQLWIVVYIGVHFRVKIFLDNFNFRSTLFSMNQCAGVKISKYFGSFFLQTSLILPIVIRFDLQRPAKNSTDPFLLLNSCVWQKS